MELPPPPDIRPATGALSPDLSIQETTGLPQLDLHALVLSGEQSADTNSGEDCIDITAPPERGRSQAQWYCGVAAVEHTTKIENSDEHAPSEPVDSPDRVQTTSDSSEQGDNPDIESDESAPQVQAGGDTIDPPEVIADEHQHQEDLLQIPEEVGAVVELEVDKNRQPVPVKVTFPLGDRCGDAMPEYRALYKAWCRAVVQENEARARLLADLRAPLSAYPDMFKYLDAAETGKVEIDEAANRARILEHAVTRLSIAYHEEVVFTGDIAKVVYEGLMYGIKLLTDKKIDDHDRRDAVVTRMLKRISHQVQDN